MVLYFPGREEQKLIILINVQFSQTSNWSLITAPHSTNYRTNVDYLNEAISSGINKAFGFWLYVYYKNSDISF